MHTRQSYTSLFLFLLSAVTGLLSLGCTPTDGNQVKLETTPQQTDTHAVAGAEKSAVSHGVQVSSPDHTAAVSEPLAESVQSPSLAQDKDLNSTSLPEIITGMEVGMPYAEARALIDQTIWAPRTHPPLDNIGTAVQNMRDLGYEEVRDCAGTGLGLCRMEFIEREGLVLVIIVTTSEAEPMVWTWDVE